MGTWKCSSGLGSRHVNENLSRNSPSVRTLRSWKMNQTPMSSSRSYSLNAVATHAPVRLRIGACSPVLITGGDKWCWSETLAPNGITGRSASMVEMLSTSSTLYSSAITVKCEMSMSLIDFSSCPDPEYWIRNLTQGGGHINRRSLSPNPHIRVLTGC